MTRRPDWQQEFKRWAPDLNVVMYVGNRESREIIRRTEFYTPPMGNQRPQLKFNVLLTTYEMVLKDEEELGYAPVGRVRVARLAGCTDKSAPTRLAVAYGPRQRHPLVQHGGRRGPPLEERRVTAARRAPGAVEWRIRCGGMGSATQSPRDLRAPCMHSTTTRPTACW